MCEICRLKTAEAKKARLKRNREKVRQNRRERCDFDCFNCKYPDCINGNAPVTLKERTMLEAAFGKSPEKAKERVFVIEPVKMMDITIDREGIITIKM